MCVNLIKSLLDPGRAAPTGIWLGGRVYSKIWALFHSRPPLKSFIFYKFCNSSMPGPPPHKLGPLYFFLGGGQLNGCLEMRIVPECMTKGRTCLILKDRSKSGLVSNNRPITCLPLIWKLLTGIIGQSVYNRLEEEQILPPEQKVVVEDVEGQRISL
jgi:hypothetical protein